MHQIIVYLSLRRAGLMTMMVVLMMIITIDDDVGDAGDDDNGNDGDDDNVDSPHGWTNSSSWKECDDDIIRFFSKQKEVTRICLLFTVFFIQGLLKR